MGPVVPRRPRRATQANHSRNAVDGSRPPGAPMMFAPCEPANGLPSQRFGSNLPLYVRRSIEGGRRKSSHWARRTQATLHVEAHPPFLSYPPGGSIDVCPSPHHPRIPSATCRRRVAKRRPDALSQMRDETTMIEWRMRLRTPARKRHGTCGTFRIRTWRCFPDPTRPRSRRRSQAVFVTRSTNVTFEGARFAGPHEADPSQESRGRDWSDPCRRRNGGAPGSGDMSAVSCGVTFPSIG